MRTGILLIFLFLSNLALSQARKHQAIPGTKYSIIPPRNFLPASAFGGFQNIESGATIMVNEIPASFQSLKDGFTEEALRSKGMKLVNKKNVDISSGTGKLLEVSQEANGATFLKQILLFGDSTKTTLVTGIYPEANKALEAEIIESLLSTQYNVAQTEDLLDAVPFTVDVSGTEFKVTKYASGSLMYTTDGKLPTDHPYLVVGISIAKVSTADLEQYCIDRLKKLPNGESVVVSKISPIQIDNLNGYEIIASGKGKMGVEELVYQAMLFTDTGDYFIIVGLAAYDMEKIPEGFQDGRNDF